jgi:hypothetical protein
MTSILLLPVFEDEEVISGSVHRDPVGELTGLCGLSVDQLDLLFLCVHIQSQY